MKRLLAIALGLALSSAAALAFKAATSLPTGLNRRHPHA